MFLSYRVKMSKKILLLLSIFLTIVLYSNADDPCADKWVRDNFWSMNWNFIKTLRIEDSSESLTCNYFSSVIPIWVTTVVPIILVAITGSKVFAQKCQVSKFHLILVQLIYRWLCNRDFLKNTGWKNNKNV